MTTIKNQPFNFDERTRGILANFGRINKGLMFHPGNVLRTVGVERDIFGIAHLDVPIPGPSFAIADLPKFLKAIKEFELHGGVKLLVADDGKAILLHRSDAAQLNLLRYAETRSTYIVPPQTVKYDLSSANEILSLKEDWKPPVLKVLTSFDLLGNNFLRLKKVLAVGDAVVLESDGKAMTATGTNWTRGPILDPYSIKLGDFDVAEFKLTFVNRKIKHILDGSYEVSIGTRRGLVNKSTKIPNGYRIETVEGDVPIVRFKSPGLEYYIAPEIGSVLPSSPTTTLPGKAQTRLNFTLRPDEIAGLRKLLNSQVDYYHNKQTTAPKDFRTLAQLFGIVPEAFTPGVAKPFTPAANWRSQPVPTFITLNNSDVTLLCEIVKGDVEKFGDPKTKAIYPKLCELTSQD